jgi:hypothetical protein
MSHRYLRHDGVWDLPYGDAMSPSPGVTPGQKIESAAARFIELGGVDCQLNRAPGHEELIDPRGRGTVYSNPGRRMIRGEHRSVADVSEGHASAGSDLNNVVETEVSEDALIVGHRWLGGAAYGGVPGRAGVSVAFVPPIPAAGEAEIVAAIGLH